MPCSFVVMPSRFLESVMGKTVRVTISDDRVVIGTLSCVDNFGNLIVEDSSLRSPENPLPDQTLASVMVPGAHIVKLEVGEYLTDSLLMCRRSHLGMPRVERFFFLEDLQDLGERYSPSVLGEFIASRRALSSAPRRDRRSIELPATLAEYMSLPESKIGLMKRVLIVNLISNSLSVLSAALLFAISLYWDRRQIDPTTQGESIANAQPSGMCMALVVCAILSSFFSEVYSCTRIMTLRQLFSTPGNLVLLITSMISQTSSALDTLSLVVVIRWSKSLGYISSFALVIEVVVFGISLPFNAIFGLAGKKKLFRASVGQYPRYTAPGHHDLLVRAMSVQNDSSDCLRSLAVGCVVSNWRLLNELIRSKMGSVPMEGTLLLQTIVMGYFRCFSFQLIWIPLKIFFILDYGVNHIVLVSIPLSVVTIFLVCLTNVFPLPSNKVVVWRIDSTELVDVEV